MVRLSVLLKDRQCDECGSKTTRVEKHNGKYYVRWHNRDGKPLCWKCWKRLIQYPRYDKKYDKEVRQKKRITFKDKRIRLKVYPRTGRCSWCTNNIKDGTCKRTSLHHLKYLAGLPLEHTVEICNSCHIKETRRIHKFNTLDYI